MNSPKVGDYLKGTWGYDACLPTFAVVVGVTPTSVRVVELEGCSFGHQTGCMEWKVVMTQKRKGDIKTKKVRRTEKGYSIKWNEYCSLWGPWTPEVVNAYNYH